MPFYVHAVDRPGAGTGLLDLADRASAERFAAEEPYRLAGLYQQVTTARAVVLVHRGPAGGSQPLEAPNALVSGRWSPEPWNASGPGPQLPSANPEGRVHFVAVLVDDDQSCTTGIAAIVSAIPGEELRGIEAFAGQLTGEPVALTAQRWRRGGRA
jgi:hypothetical protein